jgi:hypothetical protein
VPSYLEAVDERGGAAGTEVQSPGEVARGQLTAFGEVVEGEGLAIGHAELLRQGGEELCVGERLTAQRVAQRRRGARQIARV